MLPLSSTLLREPEGKPQSYHVKIARLRGLIELAQQGTIKTVEVPDIATPGTKKLTMPAEAGLEVTTTVKSDDKNSIGLEITVIKDVTPVPHNGCRPPKRRRV